MYDNFRNFNNTLYHLENNRFVPTTTSYIATHYSFLDPRPRTALSIIKDSLPPITPPPSTYITLDNYIITPTRIYKSPPIPPTPHQLNASLLYNDPKSDRIFSEFIYTILPPRKHIPFAIILASLHFKLFDNITWLHSTTPATGKTTLALANHNLNPQSLFIPPTTTAHTPPPPLIIHDEAKPTDINFSSLQDIKRQTLYTNYLITSNFKPNTGTIIKDSGVHRRVLQVSLDHRFKDNPRHRATLSSPPLLNPLLAFIIKGLSNSNSKDPRALLRSFEFR